MTFTFISGRYVTKNNNQNLRESLHTFVPDYRHICFVIVVVL